MLTQWVELTDRADWTLARHDPQTGALATITKTPTGGYHARAYNSEGVLWENDEDIYPTLSGAKAAATRYMKHG